MLPLREAGDLLGVHYQTAYGWVRQGLLPARKVGRRYQVNVADVHALSAQRAAGTPPRPEVRVRNWQPQADRFYNAIVAGEEPLAKTCLRAACCGRAVHRALWAGRRTGAAPDRRRLGSR